MADLDVSADIALLGVDLSAADTKEEVMDAFSKANPDLSQEELESFGDNWEKNKDVVKDKTAATVVSYSPLATQQELNRILAALKTSTPLATYRALAALQEKVATTSLTPLDTVLEDVIYIGRTARTILKDTSRMDSQRLERELIQLRNGTVDAHKSLIRSRSTMDRSLFAQLQSAFAGAVQDLELALATETTVVPRALARVISNMDIAEEALGENFKGVTASMVTSSSVHMRQIYRYVEKALNVLKQGAVERAKEHLGEAIATAEDFSDTTPLEVEIGLQDCWVMLTRENSDHAKSEIERFLSKIRKFL